MANVLIVHDDSIISRVAHLLEERKKDIRFFEAILRGDPGLPDEYHHVDREAVKQRLENERWLLNDLLENIENGIFARELCEIHNQYCISKLRAIAKPKRSSRRTMPTISTIRTKVRGIKTCSVLQTMRKG